MSTLILEHGNDDVDTKSKIYKSLTTETKPNKNFCITQPDFKTYTFQKSSVEYYYFMKITQMHIQIVAWRYKRSRVKKMTLMMLLMIVENRT